MVAHNIARQNDKGKKWAQWFDFSAQEIHKWPKNVCVCVFWGRALPTMDQGRYCWKLNSEPHLCNLLDYSMSWTLILAVVFWYSEDINGCYKVRRECLEVPRWSWGHWAHKFRWVLFSCGPDFPSASRTDFSNTGEIGLSNPFRSDLPTLMVVLSSPYWLSSPPTMVVESSL